MKIETIAAAPTVALRLLRTGDCFTVAGNPGAVRMKTDEADGHGHILTVNLGNGIISRRHGDSLVIPQPDLAITGTEVS